MERGTGSKAEIAGWPAAGKTGTSQDFRDAWFIGYTGALTAGVWFGNDDDKPTKKASGSNLPAIAWNRFMTGALAGLAVAEISVAVERAAAAPVPGDVPQTTEAQELFRRLFAAGRASARLSLLRHGRACPAIHV